MGTGCSMPVPIKKNKVLENQISFDDAFALMEEELKDE